MTDYTSRLFMEMTDVDLKAVLEGSDSHKVRGSCGDVIALIAHLLTKSSVPEDPTA
jgi:hypothetical protein